MSHSEQPQEWTPEFVRELMLKSQLVDQPDFGVVISNAHNAALAAALPDERWVTKQAANEFCLKLQQQLADERLDRCEVCNSELSQCGLQGVDGEPSLDCLVCRLREQLSDEREKVKLLVDALNRAAGAIMSEDHVKMGLALVVIRDRLDALAKVKEGK